jgi:hypothetical protein
MPSAQKRLIRKDLYDKCEQNMITRAQLQEPDMLLSAVISRDLEIMINHKNALRDKIDHYKGFFTRHFIPSLRKLLLCIEGSVFMISTPIAYYGIMWSQNVWNGKGDLALKAGNFLIKAAHYIGTISFDTNMLYNKEKLERIISKHPQFMTVVALSSAATVASLFSGILFITGAYKLYYYHSHIDRARQRAEVRLKRDNAVIGRLKELKNKFDNTNQFVCFECP